jgi:hypothetical protein
VTDKDRRFWLVITSIVCLTFVGVSVACGPPVGMAWIIGTVLGAFLSLPLVAWILR